MHDLFSVAMMIVVVALVTTVVVNGAGSAGVVAAIGNAFSKSLSAAQGK